MQQTASDKAIQRMNATRTPSQQQTEVVDLVGRLQPTVSVTKEQRLADPIVRPAVSTKAGESSVVIDQLTKAFEKLSVNLITQVQAQTPQQPQGPVGSMVGVQGENYPSVNVGAYGMQQRPMGGQRLKDGVCWYCFNQDPRYQDPPHRFRHQCPWYQKHLAVGTAHINENNQPKARPAPAARVASITLLSSADSEDEEELEERSNDEGPVIFQASAARIERPQDGGNRWKNPTKILKRTETERERKLAVPKTMRLRE
jgi:hypothetical protein